jgi:hypothetical protein
VVPGVPLNTKLILLAALAVASLTACDNDKLYAETLKTAQKLDGKTVKDTAGCAYAVTQYGVTPNVALRPMHELDTEPSCSESKAQ